MIAALLLSIGAQHEPHAQHAPRPVRVVIERSNAERDAALRRDPRSLPPAAPERWKGFDPAHPAAADVPREFLAAQHDVAEGDVPSAIANLYAALDATADFPPAWHELGVLYFRLQRYGDGAACFERYLAVAPGHVKDTRGLAHCYYSLGRYEDARRHYRAVLADAPDDVEARRGLALADWRLGDTTAALEGLDAVLARQPEHAEAWTWKARLLFDLERTEEALAAAERARDLAPFTSRPWFQLARALAELGREKEATAARQRFEMLAAAEQDIHDLESRLEYRPHDVATLERLVDLRESIGDVTSVRADLVRLVRQAPSDVSLRIRVVDVLERLGDEEGARAGARELERVGRDSIDAWKRLETFWRRHGDRAKELQAGERYRRLRG